MKEMPTIYTAWVAENRSTNPVTYLALDHMLDVHWVPNIDDAVHFARREDVERVVHMAELLDIRICEHRWFKHRPNDPVVPDWSFNDSELGHQSGK